MNTLIQKECKTSIKALFFKQNDYWVMCNSSMHDSFFYKECLLLVELGNERLAK